MEFQKFDRKKINDSILIIARKNAGSTTLLKEMYPQKCCVTKDKLLDEKISTRKKVLILEDWPARKHDPSRNRQKEMWNDIMINGRRSNFH